MKQTSSWRTPRLRFDVAPSGSRSQQALASCSSAGWRINHTLWFFPLWPAAAAEPSIAGMRPGNAHLKWLPALPLGTSRLGTYVHLGVCGVCAWLRIPQVWGRIPGQGGALRRNLGLELVSLSSAGSLRPPHRFSSGPQFPQLSNRTIPTRFIS